MRVLPDFNRTMKRPGMISPEVVMGEPNSGMTDNALAVCADAVTDSTRAVAQADRNVVRIMDREVYRASDKGSICLMGFFSGNCPSDSFTKIHNGC